MHHHHEVDTDVELCWTGMPPSRNNDHEIAYKKCLGCGLCARLLYTKVQHTMGKLAAKITKALVSYTTKKGRGGYFSTSSDTCTRLKASQIRVLHRKICLVESGTGDPVSQGGKQSDLGTNFIVHNETQ